MVKKLRKYLHKDNVPLPRKLEALLRKDEGKAQPAVSPKVCQNNGKHSGGLNAQFDGVSTCTFPVDPNPLVDEYQEQLENALSSQDVLMEEINDVTMDIQGPLINETVHISGSDTNARDDLAQSLGTTMEEILGSTTIPGNFTSSINNDPNDIIQDGYFSDEDDGARKETDNFFERLRNPGRAADPTQTLPESVKISTEKNPRLLFLMGLNFSIKYMICFSAIVMLLGIINFICDTRVLPDTRYTFDKFCNPKVNYELHSTCPLCTEYLGTYGGRGMMTCGNCGSPVDMTHPSNRCFFVIFDPTDPVRDYIQMNQEYYDNIMKNRVHEKNHIRDIYDGKLYRKFRSRLSPRDRSSYATFILNTDGVPLYESSGCSVWPIYLMLNEIPPNKRFNCLILAGLWVGNGKPVMDVFLDKFVKQMNKLSTNGISCTIKGEERTIKLFTLQCSVDTIARFPMNATKQFNAEYGCDWCLQQGVVPRVTPNDNSRIYPYEFPLNSRTRENAILFAQEALHRGKSFMGVSHTSPLLNLHEFDFINGFSPEYMHQYLAGVVAQLTEHIISGLSSAEFEELNRSLLKIKVPNQLGRLSRSLKSRADYKCKEWENWALYYSVPILSKFMKNKAQLKHWTLLVNALYIGLKVDIHYDDLNRMSEMLHQFVREITEFYPRKALTYNVHQLLHIVESIYNWGPLWAHSAFAFESANRGLLASIHSEKGIILQIIRHANIVRLQQLFENTVHQDCSDIERAYCSVIFESLNEKVVKLANATYFGTGKPISKSFASRFNIPEKMLWYHRAVISGSLYMSSQKENLRTCNYHAKLRIGKFIKISKFLIDFDNRMELTICQLLRVRRHASSEEVREVLSINDQEELIHTHEIDSPCVFVRVDTKNFITAVPHKLRY